jgi:hypothetical protein
MGRETRECYPGSSCETVNFNGYDITTYDRSMEVFILPRPVFVSDVSPLTVTN